VLALVGMTALSFIHSLGFPEVTRLALTQAVLTHHSLRIDRWQAQTIDKAVYGGHYYSDKAPGMSFLAIPPLLLFRSAGAVDGEDELPGVWKKRSLLWTSVF
jgi:hypothetical protein